MTLLHLPSHPQLMTLLVVQMMMLVLAEVLLHLPAVRRVPHQEPCEVGDSSSKEEERSSHLEEEEGPCFQEHQHEGGVERHSEDGRQGSLGEGTDSEMEEGSEGKDGHSHEGGEEHRTSHLVVMDEEGMHPHHDVLVEEPFRPPQLLVLLRSFS